MLLILALLLLLDHPRWAVRVGAERCLTPANAVTLPLLEAREKVGPAEGARRAHWLVNDYYRRHADRLSRTLGRLPSIHHLPGEWSYDIRDDFLQQATESGTAWDDRGGEATRLLIRECIANRRCVTRLLAEMRENERRHDQGD